MCISVSACLTSSSSACNAPYVLSLWLLPVEEEDDSGREGIHCFPQPDEGPFLLFSPFSLPSLPSYYSIAFSPFPLTPFLSSRPLLLPTPSPSYSPTKKERVSQERKFIPVFFFHEFPWVFLLDLSYAWFSSRVFISLASVMYVFAWSCVWFLWTSQNF